MAKRYRSNDDDHRGSRSRCPPQRHLCVVLDDWSKGYSVYKLDVDGFDGHPDDPDLDLPAERLPDPPLFRLEIPSDETGHFARFAAVGSRVFAMDYGEEDRDAPVLVYDTATGTPFELQETPKLLAAGDSLYAFDRRKRDGGQEDQQSFKVLERHGRRGWVWSSLRAAPFDLMRTACHAAHPDGRTIFFSAHGKGTFSFDARTEEWMLPFQGQAYYDGEVDAWVGLRWGSVEWTRGASAPATSWLRAATVARKPPAWKLAEEEMAQDSERSMGVELAHMGDGRFCLVEYLKRRGLAEDEFDEHCQILATTFRLRYDRNGALRAAGHAATRSVRNRTRSSSELLE